MSPSPSVNSFADIANPFSSSAVGSVWDPVVADVPTVQAEATARLLRVIEQRGQGHPHRCQIVYGEPGFGKTHLLRRIRLTLEGKVLFSWVRLHTSPLLMWRHIRYHLADDLARRQQELFQKLLAERAGAGAEPADRDLGVVLEHLLAGRHMRDARAWLAGKALPEAVLREMGLAASDADDETIEDESRRIVLALLAYLRPASVVICLDQMEAMQAHPGDKQGLFAIGKLLSTFHDEASNAVTIGCAQTGLVHELDRTLSKAEQDRFETVTLRAVERESERRELVLRRLETCGADLARFRPENADETWPIDLARLASQNQREALSVRQLFYQCGEMFREAQHLPDEHISLQDRIAEHYQRCMSEAARELDGDRSTGILSDGLPRLWHVRGRGIDRKDLPRGLDHVITGSGDRRTLVVLGNGSPVSLLNKLRRLEASGAIGQDASGLVIVRDAFHPLSVTAVKTQQAVRDLKARGARVVTPSREALLALDAARRLLADAESGELSYRGARVALRDVEEWVRKTSPASLGTLLDQMAASAPSKAAGRQLLEQLLELLNREKVIGVDQAASALAATAEEVVRCARHHQEAVGLLAGAQPAVFRRPGHSTATGPRAGGASGGSSRGGASHRG